MSFKKLPQNVVDTICEDITLKYLCKKDTSKYCKYIYVRNKTKPVL